MTPTFKERAEKEKPGKKIKQSPEPERHGVGVGVCGVEGTGESGTRGLLGRGHLWQVLLR